MRVARIVGFLMMAGAVLMAQAGAGGRAQNTPAPGQRLVNPESIAARLMLATPEQRQRALAQFPPARQAQIRKQLEWFDSLSKAEQSLQIRRLQLFASLPPDRQVTVRLQMQALSRLAPARRQAIRRALLILQSLPPRQRAVRLDSPAFRSRFSDDEREIIADLADAWLPPPAPPPPEDNQK